jgi:hypothetical protein
MSSSVNNKSDSDEFDEEDADDSPEGAEELDVDHLIKSLERLKRRGAKLSDPAWRRLERYKEDKHTEEMLSDFDDYDLTGEFGPGDAGQAHGDAEEDSAARHARKKRKD